MSISTVSTGAVVVVAVATMRSAQTEQIATDIERVLLAEAGGTRHGDEITFRCVHPDRHSNGDAKPSASYNVVKRLWCCRVCGARGGYKKLAAALGIELNNEPRGRVVATYDYRDERNELLFQVVRREGKRFSQRRPDGRGGWIYKLDDVRRVLYRLPELLAAQLDAFVFVVEGEKDVEALRGLGLVATCNPGGAGKWRSEYNEHFRNRRVVVISDADAPGRRHADEVVRTLLSVATTVQRFELDGAKDAADWIAAGHGKDELLALVEQCEPLTAAAVVESETSAPLHGGKKSQATLLVDLAHDANIELFHDSREDAFASVCVAEHQETHALRTRGFRGYLTRLYFEKTQKAASAQSLQEALAVLEAQARFDGACKLVAVRVAEHNENIYIDLADAAWQVVEITAAGWRVIDAADAAVRVRRARGMVALPEPAAGGNIETLRRFVNVVDDVDFTLLRAWLVAALRARGPYPVLALHGEQGSAKSTTARLLRALVDPNVAAVRAAPRDVRDLAIAAANGWIIALDNMSYVDAQLSDALCRLATGGGFSTRELYSDAEEMIFDAQRPVVVNGIEDIISRGDLLDRTLTLTLPALPVAKRRTEAELLRDFNEQQPQLLGALFVAVAAALANVKYVQLSTPPRMADFAVWVTAAAPALDFTQDEFLDAYADNRESASALTLESSKVAVAVRDLIATTSSWEGTATELLEALDARASEAVKHRKDWPHTPRALGGTLRRLAPDLRRAGVEVDFVREGHSRSRTIRISSSAPSASSAKLNFIDSSADGADANHAVADANTDRPSAKKLNKHGAADGADDADAKKHNRSGSQPRVLVEL